MLNEYQPVVDQWYRHQDKGQPFLVVAVDDDAEAIEIQFFDGTLEEISFTDWAGFNVEECEEPDSWAGVLEDIDVGEVDDMSADIIDSDDVWDDAYEHLN